MELAREDEDAFSLDDQAVLVPFYQVCQPSAVRCVHRIVLQKQQEHQQLVKKTVPQHHDTTREKAKTKKDPDGKVLPSEGAVKWLDSRT